MSLNAELAAAAIEAQTALADIQGGGLFTISGDAKPYTGVFYEHNEADPLGRAGIENIRLLEIVATKAQWTVAPSAGPRRTLTAKSQLWILVSTTDMPLHYRLTCKPAN